MNRTALVSMSLAASVAIAACARQASCPTVDPDRLSAAIRAEWAARAEGDDAPSRLGAGRGGDGDDDADREARDGDGDTEGDEFDSGIAADAERIRVPVTSDQPSRGSESALVTIVVFTDFQCPFCSRVNPTLDALMQRYEGQIRFVMRNEPLPFHDRAVPAAEAAREAFVQGGNTKFWAMHDLIFANQQALTDVDLEHYAVQVGLDQARFREAMLTRAHRSAIDADLELAHQIGADGTPNFFINGTQLVGAQPEAAFARAIERELDVARSLVRRGTSPSDVYATLMRDARDRPTPADVPEPTPDPTRPDPAATYRVPLGRHPQVGPADALVTIVEFSDFQCPFCSRVEPTLTELRARYGRDLRVVWMNNPLAFHDNARPAAEAALEVFAQKQSVGFFAYHALLFENQRELERATLESLAERTHVNMVRFRRALDTHTHEAEIVADQDLATRLGARGTPAFFINGRFLSGAQPVEAFATLIDEELAKARALVRQGVPRRRVYERTIEHGLDSVGGQGNGGTP